MALHGAFGDVLGAFGDVLGALFSRFLLPWRASEQFRFRFGAFFSPKANVGAFFSPKANVGAFFGRASLYKQ
jgi:hypothetical protein